MATHTPNFKLHVRAGELWVEQRLRNRWHRWLVASRIQADERGLPVIAEVRVLPAGDVAPLGGVPATLLRRGLALGAHVRFAYQMIAGSRLRAEMNDSMSKLLVSVLEPHGFKVGRPAAMLPANQTKRGRPQVWTDADYARVALIYDNAIRAGRSPQREVMTVAGTSIAIARNLIAKARKIGKLPPSAGSGRREVARLSEERRTELKREGGGSRIQPRLSRAESKQAMLT